jgi:hypothetical protein
MVTMREECYSDWVVVVRLITSAVLDVKKTLVNVTQEDIVAIMAMLIYHRVGFVAKGWLLCLWMGFYGMNTVLLAAKRNLVHTGELILKT